jgi:hypothetical protein
MRMAGVLEVRKRITRQKQRISHSNLNHPQTGVLTANGRTRRHLQRSIKQQQGRRRKINVRKSSPA